MTNASIPVDLFNPGQVFACFGFMEAAEILLDGTSAGFDWSAGNRVRFILVSSGPRNPIEAVLGFLASARVIALAPPGSGNDTEKWDVPTRPTAKGAPFPCPDPDSPATLPAALEGPGADGSGVVRLPLEHWGDESRPDKVKFWAGSGGYPGAALARDALDLIRDRCKAVHVDPFALAAPQSSSFRFDWRRDYIPMDIGFSLNNQSHMSPQGYPLVELLAAIGLTNARPARVDKLTYRYGVVSRTGDLRDRAQPAPGQSLGVFPPALLRASLGCAPLPFSFRTFRMHLGWPGKEGQARAITTVIEETRS